MNQLIGNFQVEHDSFKLQVELNLPAQGVTALFGPSGSGKTTNKTP